VLWGALAEEEAEGGGTAEVSVGEHRKTVIVVVTVSGMHPSTTINDKMEVALPAAMSRSNLPKGRATPSAAMRRPIAEEDTC